MNSNWRRIFSEVWQNQKEWILGIIGLTLSTPFITDGPLWWIGGVWAVTLGYLGYIVIWEYRQVKALEAEKPVPFMVIVGRDEDSYFSMNREVMQAMGGTHFEEQLYRDVWKVIYQNMELYEENRLPYISERWKELVQQFNKKVVRLDRKLPNRTIFHLFLNCPAVLALGLGARSGVHHEVVLYHYQRAAGQSPYIRVIDLSFSTVSQLSTQTDGVRLIKKQIQKPYRFIRVKGLNNKDLKDTEILVKVYLAGHDPTASVEQMAASHNWALVHIDKSQDMLPTAENSWLRPAQEVSTVLMQLAAQAKRIHLCWSAPVPLAFAVGMALGTHSPITLYQWNPSKSSYHPVLNLEKLRE
ncbi:MAG: SAVED domain-containing protein [Ardenticatenaceae bacterium]